MNLDSLRPWVALFLILFAGSCILKTHHHLVTFREGQKAAERNHPKTESPSKTESSSNSKNQGDVR